MNVGDLVQWIADPDIQYEDSNCDVEYGLIVEVTEPSTILSERELVATFYLVFSCFDNIIYPAFDDEIEVVCAGR